MNTYNMMTCTSTNGAWNLGAILSDCSFAWFAFAIILFLCLIARRQFEDGALSGFGSGFNLIGGLVGGLGLLVLVITFTGSPRWGLLAGVGGMAVGGLGIGFLTGGGSGE